jgi:hypothetical protein
MLKTSGNKGTISSKDLLSVEKSEDFGTGNCQRGHNRVQRSTRRDRGCQVGHALDSKVLFKSHATDLKDTSIVVRRANESADMPTAKIILLTSVGRAKIDDRNLAFNPIPSLLQIELPQGQQ